MGIASMNLRRERLVKRRAVLTGKLSALATSKGTTGSQAVPATLDGVTSSTATHAARPQAGGRFCGYNIQS